MLEECSGLNIEDISFISISGMLSITTEYFSTVCKQLNKNHIAVMFLQNTYILHRRLWGKSCFKCFFHCLKN